MFLFHSFEHFYQQLQTVVGQSKYSVNIGARKCHCPLPTARNVFDLILNYLIESGRLQSFSKCFANSSQICDRFLAHWFGNKISVLLWCARHIYSVWIFFRLVVDKVDKCYTIQIHVARQLHLNNMTKLMALQRKQKFNLYTFNVNGIGMTKSHRWNDAYWIGMDAHYLNLTWDVKCKSFTMTDWMQRHLASSRSKTIDAVFPSQYKYEWKYDEIFTRVAAQVHIKNVCCNDLIKN